MLEFTPMNSNEARSNLDNLKRRDTIWGDDYWFGEGLSATVLLLLENYPPDGTIEEQWEEVQMFWAPSFFIFVNCCPTGRDVNNGTV